MNYPIMSVYELKRFSALLEENNISNHFLSDYIKGGRNILYCVYPHEETDLNYFEYRNKQIDTLIKVFRKDRNLYNYLHLISYAYMPPKNSRFKFKIPKLDDEEEDFIIYFDD